MVFQQYSLFPWKTVRENVEFGLKLKKMDRFNRERAARTCSAWPDCRPSRTTTRTGCPAA